MKKEELKRLLAEARNLTKEENLSKEDALDEAYRRMEKKKK